MKPLPEWIITRIDGKIAAISQDIRNILHKNQHGRAFRSGGKDNRGRSCPFRHKVPEHGMEKAFQPYTS